MTGQLGVGLGPRDEQLLLAAARLRLVTGGQLQRLVFAGPDASTQNARIARRCLERLTAQHLLQRLERRVGGLRAGSSSYVYAIAPAGAAAIGWSIGRSRVHDPSLTFLRHQLAVAEVFVRLHEARHADVFLDLAVQTEPTCWRPLDDGTGSILKPDLYALVALAAHERLAFIEVDNSTEHAAALKRKAALYAAHYASGYEQRAEGVVPEVLWVAPDAHRAQQLRDAFEHLPGWQLHHVLETTDELITYLAADDIPP